MEEEKDKIDLDLNLDFESIVPWNGQQDSGRDVRLKLDRNWQRVIDAFHKLSEYMVTGEYLDKRYLRKDKEDAAQEIISFLKGIVTDIIQSSDFSSGELGSGFVIKNEGDSSYMEIDRLLVRRVAYFVELIIKSLKHIGGTLVLTPASMRCSRVEEFDAFYRCYFENERDGKTIKNEFVAGDQARSQTFNVKKGVNNNVSSQFYWRLVIAVGDNYIDLSKSDAATGSMAPLAGDDIVQLGNRDDDSRQNAIILSTVGDDAPSIKQYKGIIDYSLTGREATVISPVYNKFTGRFKSSTSDKDLDALLDEFNTNLNKIKEQTDQSYTIWYFTHNPTFENEPAVNWDEDDMADHEYDLFYNEEEGLAWRFSLGEDGKYYWKPITDKQTLAALEKAAKAQRTADSKSTNFVSQPTPPYQIGDRWSKAVYPASGDDKGATYDNDDLVCIKSKAEGEEFEITDWEPASGLSSKDRKYFYSEFKRLDNAITSIVGSGQNRDEAIATAQAAAEAADKAAKNAQKTADSASSAAETNASAISQTDKYISLVAAAFEKNEDGSLKLDKDGKPILTKSAGAVITADSASLYATKTTTDALNKSITQAKSDITTMSDKITALSEKITTDKDGNITNISKSGLVLESNFAKLFSERVTADGIAKTASIKTYVDDEISKIEISADKIDLTGVITMNMFSDALKDDLGNTYCKIGEVSADDLAKSLNDLIDGKANSNDLGTLAKRNSVSKDDLSTALQKLIDDKADSINIKGLAYYDNVLEALDAQALIAGGFIKASMIDVDNLYAKKLSTKESADGSYIDITDGRIRMKNGDLTSIQINSSDKQPAIWLTNSSGDSNGINGTGFYHQPKNKGTVSIIYGNINLSSGATIKGLAVGNIGTSFGTDTDFIVGSGTITLPSASTYKGKVIFIKCTSTTTIRSLSPIYKGNEYKALSKDDNGYYNDSYSARSMFFISNGSNWFEFTCWYR